LVGIDPKLEFARISFRVSASTPSFGGPFDFEPIVDAAAGALSEQSPEFEAVVGWVETIVLERADHTVKRAEGDIFFVEDAVGVRESASGDQRDLPEIAVPKFTRRIFVTGLSEVDPFGHGAVMKLRRVDSWSAYFGH
jgi:hypothetical protein